MMERVPVGAMVVTVALRMAIAVLVNALVKQGESAALLPPAPRWPRGRWR